MQLNKTIKCFSKISFLIFYYLSHLNIMQYNIITKDNKLIIKMSRQPINFQKTIIYKLVCNDINITDIYVGATTDFIRRKSEHKASCNNPNNKKYNLKIYQCIRDNGGFINWTMLEVEKYPCNNNHESAIRERFNLELLSANLNKRIPCRTIQEYNETNKEKISSDHKQYRELNKEK